MPAILTKYIGPTDSKGSRIRASWKRWDGRTDMLTIGYDSGLSERDNHAAAAMALVRKCTSPGSGNNWTCGELPNGDYAFVMLGEEFSRHFGTMDHCA